ncbi:hypothetical protein [Streptomyces sp. NPDC006285]|uniref:hypothetical protein n=1 Tax=Streptomyces sp. NPDC006285 TaxID=3364742 RepID=UPI0036B24779
MLRTCATALCVALCCALSACTTDTAGPPRAEPGRTGPVTAAERSLLYDAEQALVQRCMQRRHFTVWKVPEHPVPDARQFPYVLDDVGWAKEHGYGSDLERRVRALQESDPNKRYARALSPERRAAALTALHGGRPYDLRVKLRSGAEVTRSSEGCVAQAESELYGDVATWFRAEAVTQELSAERRRSVVGDPAFRAAVASWSACMRERGLRHADPDTARARFTSPSGTPSRRLEIRTAVAEARCAADSELAATADRLDRHRSAVLRATYAVIRDRDRLQKTALPRARSALAAE